MTKQQSSFTVGIFLKLTGRIFEGYGAKRSGLSGHF